MALPLDVDGPVTAEVFTLAMGRDGLLLTGPCGAAPWLIEAGRTEHPLDTVRRIVEDTVEGVRLVHSTSWRFDRGSVILAFLTVVDEVGEMEAAPVGRAQLARSEATAAPSTISYEQVLEHAIRHLAWLAAEDQVVRETLDGTWHAKLSAYVPEPFQQLGGDR